jgi:trk system potassium uptake protein TrkA
LGLQTIAPTIWGINRIADLLCHSRLDTVLTLGNGEVDIVHVEVPPTLIGKPVRDISIFGEISVVAITRKGKAFLPSHGTLFEAGDQVHIAVISDSTDRLNTLLEMR